MADRAVLPADEADAADHEIRRKIGKRGAHPDRRRLDRLSSSARPATDQRRARLPRARSTRARQSDAQKRSHTAPKTAASPATRLASSGYELRLARAPRRGDRKRGCDPQAAV